MPAGLGSNEDRLLEQTIKQGALFASQRRNPFLSSLRCLQEQASQLRPGPPAQVVNNRRSMRRASKWGAGGETMPVLDKYHYRDAGEEGSLEWRRFIIDDNDVEISYWHDLPLSAGPKTVHAFIEIPKDTTAKVPPSLRPNVS